MDPVFPNGVEETGSLVRQTLNQRLKEGWTKARQLQVNQQAQEGRSGGRAAPALRMYQFRWFNKATAFSSTAEGPVVVLAVCLERVVWDLVDLRCEGGLNTTALGSLQS